MKNHTISNESCNQVYSVEIQIQNIYLPALEGYEEILLDLHINRPNVPLSDCQYINDKEYVVSVAQY
jgi:hypothetical protein